MLVAPYCTMLECYCCETHVARYLSREVTTPPKWCDTPPWVLNFTQAHLCDTPFFFLQLSHDNCVIPHKNKHERVLQYYRCKYQRAPNPPEFAQPRLSRSNGGHRQREGTNLGVFVPIWLVLIAQGSLTYHQFQHLERFSKGSRRRFEGVLKGPLKNPSETPSESVQKLFRNPC